MSKKGSEFGFRVSENESRTVTDFFPTPMQQAIALAREAAVAGEVPVGAVIVDARSGAVIAAARNRVEEYCDPTAHAEMLAIKQAMARDDGRKEKYLSHCDLYVTLEPCPMCAAAIGFTRIRRIYYGAFDPKSGGVDHGPRVLQSGACHHKPEVIGGMMESECGELLKTFFEAKR